MIAVAHMAGKAAFPSTATAFRLHLHPARHRSVGLTEAQARAQGRDVKVGRFPFAGNSRAPSSATTKGSSR